MVVRQALGELGLTDHPVTLQRVETPEEAERLSFKGHQRCCSMVKIRSPSLGHQSA